LRDQKADELVFGYRRYSRPTLSTAGLLVGYAPGYLNYVGDWRKGRPRFTTNIICRRNGERSGTVQMC